MKRSKFLKTSLLGGISILRFPSLEYSFKPGPRKVKYDLSLDSPTHYYDGKNCFIHPRVGIVPNVGENGLPRVVLTMNTLDLSESDVFKAVYGMQTDNLGKTWTKPRELDNLSPHYEVINGEKRPVAVSDFWPGWHRNSKTLLGTGHTVVYTPGWKVSSPRPRHTTYSIYNSSNNIWSKWQKLEMPDLAKFKNCGAGSTQRYDKADGTILLPVYFHTFGKLNSVTVVRCTFYRNSLRYLEHGDELSISIPRGLYEPSLTFYQGHYFLTMRNDQRGYVTKGSDGLHFEQPKPWTFDNGEELGNYNTQQHWVTHSDGLFLVYTRRGADNDHVVRHRAPLFIAQIDPEKLCVIRRTERIIVPEHGATLGNFGVTDVSRNETWVTVAEVMQKGAEEYGSDGRVFIARIHWDKSNQLFELS